VNIATAPDLVLYENDDAWTGAILVDADVSTVHVPPLADCPNERLLCRDLSVVMNLKPAAVAIVRSEGAIDVTFDRLEMPRTLVVAEMFRPGLDVCGNRWRTGGDRRVAAHADAPIRMN
jgi:hypothetical protein